VRHFESTRSEAVSQREAYGSLCGPTDLIVTPVLDVEIVNAGVSEIHMGSH